MCTLPIQNPVPDTSPTRPVDMRRNGFKENFPPRPDTPEDPIVTKMGGYDDKRRKLQEERKKEYNSLLQKVLHD